MTTLDPTFRVFIARMWILPHRLEYPVFLVAAFSDAKTIRAHTGARLDLPDRSLHVDFGPILDADIQVQHWTVWRDEPWPDLDRLVRQGHHDDEHGAGLDPVALLSHR